MKFEDTDSIIEDYHQRGWAIMPLDGKKPILNGWTTLPAPSLEQALEWGAKGNVGLRTGRISGAVVLDVDPKSGGNDSLEKLKAEGLNLDDAPHVETGGGGSHYYFAAPETPVGNSVGKLGAGLDFKGEGGAIVLPPSVHPDTGEKYEWFVSPNGHLPPLPKILLDRLSAHKPVTQKITSGDCVVQGSRNDFLFRQACALRARGLGVEAIRGALTAENQARCNPPLPESEVQGIAASVTRYDATADADTLTDSGNARRFAGFAGGNFRFTKAHGWLSWDGKRWKPDDTGAARQAGKNLARHLLAAGVEIEDQLRRERFMKNALGLENKTKLDAMVELAKSEPPIVAGADGFDRDPWLFNVQNGTIDLRTGKLRPHSRDDMITKISPVEFQEGAACLRFKEFLNEIFDDNIELCRYLQRLYGYFLTGSTKEHLFPISQGSGGNGKSVMANVMRMVWGDYCMTTPASTFLNSRFGGAIRNDLARLGGSRLVFASESQADATLDEALIKEITGGEPITVRYLHKEFFTFVPQFKFVLSTNHRPVVRGTDYALWRRLVLIPYNRTFLKDEQDKDLLCKLEKERAGILQWIIRGCLKWQEHGLGESKTVLMAVDTYKSDSDTLGDFIGEYLIEKPEGKAMTNKIYHEYKAWADRSGLTHMSQKGVANALQERGFIRGGGMGARGYFKGWVLKDIDQCG